ncbi:PLP-dependent transferase [Mesorhizobium delmotii]|uniref:PLP-dependent transferase n=1 Tax=Mesorhizobium delmotii TaxID=1631247 RepID=UPI000F43E3BB
MQPDDRGPGKTARQSRRSRSWAGTYPASLTRSRKSVRKDAHLPDGVGDDLMRLSVGLEDAAVLIADLEQALDGV